ncbi:MAG: putative RDD family membrane protein YckC [Desulforhopalus sp.]
MPNSVAAYLNVSQQNKMNLLSPLTLILLSIYPLVLGGIYLFSFPYELYEGSKSPILLYVITGCLLLLSILCFRPSSRISKETNTNPSNVRWVFLALGFLTSLLGLSGTLYFWYAIPEPAPTFGIMCNVCFSIITAFLWYFASSKNSKNNPNLMRIIITICVLLFGGVYPLVLSLILLYAFPSTQITAYPTAASLSFIAILAFGILVFQLHRESYNEDLKTNVASRKERLGAALVDGLMLLVINSPIFYFSGAFDYIVVNETLPLRLTIILALLGVFTFFILNGKLLISQGRTIGKKLFNIKIVSLNDELPTIKQIIIKRYIPYLGFPYIPFVGGILNMVNICCIFGKESRCLHDFIAKTKVIKG